MHGRDARGFTLLELLVAVAIFALAAQLAYGGLRQLLDGRAALAPRFEEAARLRHALTLLERDFSAARPRAVRDALGDRAPAFVAGNGETLAQFSRGDAGRPTLLDAVGLYRVAYRLEQDELLRDTWPVLDAVQATRPVTQRVLDGVAGFSLRCLDADDEWVTVWPAAAGELAVLPRAVEIELSFEDGRSLRRLLLPGSGG
jgi:general secretion pathway protein J